MRGILNEKFTGIILGSAILSGLMTGSLGVAVVVAVVAGAAAVYLDMLRF